MMSGGRLRIRLIGGLELRLDGRALGLPASRKSRALLAHLVATATPHRREALCDLLWDGPADPRSELDRVQRDLEDGDKDE
jgi:DNA-binding SARP family transcriptional activator